MTKVLFSEGCREFDAPSGRRYYAREYRQGGTFDVSPSDAKAMVQMGGAIASVAGSTGKQLGYRCPCCGFGSYLKVCGRCGGTCEREGVAPAVGDAAPAAGVAKTGDEP